MQYTYQTDHILYNQAPVCFLAQTAVTEPSGDHPVGIRGHVSVLSLASVHHKGVFNLLMKYKVAVDDTGSDCFMQSYEKNLLLLFSCISPI